MKKSLLLISGLIGILFSLFDAMASYADTAPIDIDLGIEIISWDKFILKNLLYMMIGLIIQFTLKKGKKQYG